MEKQEDEISINFKAFFAILKNEWLSICVITLLFIAVGIYTAYTTKVEFVSEGRILPESQGKSGSGLGNLAGLAGLAGINIDASGGGGGDAIRSDLYPDVVQSTPFFIDLMNKKVINKDNKEVVFKDFYTNEILAKPGIMSSLFSSEQKNEGLTPKISEKNIIALSRQDDKAIENLKKRILANYDKKTGVISISAKMPDPVVAATVAKITMDYLTQYITNYHTQKFKHNVAFLQDRVNEVRGRYYGQQVKKAQYNDQMQYIKQQTADLQRERIQSDYQVSSSLYSTLIGQLEQAKIKLQEETPVLTILDPPKVPVNKSEPLRLNIILLYSILGILLGILFALFRKKNYQFVFSK